MSNEKNQMTVLPSSLKCFLSYLLPQCVCVCGGGGGGGGTLKFSISIGDADCLVVKILNFRSFSATKIS